MNGKLILYMGCFGSHYVCRSAKELQSKAGPGRMFKIYQDKNDGRIVHTGYGVGREWFTAFVPYEEGTLMTNEKTPVVYVIMHRVSREETQVLGYMHDFRAAIKAVKELSNQNGGGYYYYEMVAHTTIAKLVREYT